MLMRNCSSTLWATTSKHSRYEDFAEEKSLVDDCVEAINTHAGLTGCHSFSHSVDATCHVYHWFDSVRGAKSVQIKPKAFFPMCSGGVCVGGAGVVLCPVPG